MPIDNTLLETIRQKPEADRSPAENALLSAADEQAGSGDIDWDKAFQHPRFKQLVSDKKKAEDELKSLKEKQDQEAGNYRTLYETAKQELEQEKQKSGRAETLEATLKKTLDAELANLTPEARKLIPSKLSTEDKLDWIAENRAALTRTRAQDIGAGGGRSLQNQKPGKTELSAEEKQVAQLFGYSAEEYAKFRDMTNVEPFSANRRATPESESTEE